MKFQKRPDRIEAFQFDGTFESMQKLHKVFFPDHVNFSLWSIDAFGVLILHNFYRGHEILKIYSGEWVYRDNDDVMHSITDDNLTKFYESVKEE